MDAVALMERCRKAEEECQSLQARVDRLRAAGVTGDTLARRILEAELRRESKAAEEKACAVLLDELFAGDDRSREVLWHFYVGRLTVNAISTRLHLSAGRVKSIKAAAMRILETPEAGDRAAELLDKARG